MVQLIDTSVWKEFTVPEVFITEQHGKSLKVPTGAMMSKKDLIDGDIPRVTVSNFNNGITGYYADSDDKNYRTYENFISVSFLGTVFYQSEKVSLDMKVHCLKPIDYELNEYSAGYIVSVVRKTIMNFEYADQLSSTVLADLSLKLPATVDGQPDWEYMETYMKQIMEESEKSLENLKKADDTKHPIDISGWGAFRVGDLFKKLDTGFLGTGKKKDSISKEPTEEFYVPLSYAKRYNNGIMYWGRKGEWKTHKNALTVVYNGAVSAGRVYAQSDETGVLAESYMIKLKNVDVSFFTYLFLQRIMEDCIYHKYSYSDLAVWDSVKENNIYFPITIAGEPDWQYMEDYMKSIMDQSEKVIEYLNTYTKGKE